MTDEPWTWPAFAAAIVASAVFALIVHELGHVLAAGALGGERFRVVVAWPALRVEADLPEGRGASLSFLAAGALANLGGAAALYGTSEKMALPAVLQIVVALLALAPIGTSDGARILAELKLLASRQEFE